MSVMERTVINRYALFSPHPCSSSTILTPGSCSANCNNVYNFEELFCHSGLLVQNECEIGGL